MSEPNPMQQQINDLKSMISQLFQDVKETLSGIETRLRNIESTTIAEIAVIRQRVDEMEKDLNGLGVKLETLEKTYNADAIELKTTIKILKWLLGIATAIIIALLVKLFTDALIPPTV